MYTITVDQQPDNFTQSSQVVLGAPSVKGYVRVKGKVTFVGRANVVVKRYNHFTVDQVSLTADNEDVFIDQTIFYEP